MPFLLLLKPFFEWFKNLPWQVYAGIALCVLIFFARLHWIGVGVERCEARQAKAQQKALAESITQELNAPAIAQKAQADIEPIIIERVRVIRENIKYTACADVAYPDGVQQAIREASSTADRVR